MRLSVPSKHFCLWETKFHIWILQWVNGAVSHLFSLAQVFQLPFVLHQDWERKFPSSIHLWMMDIAPLCEWTQPTSERNTDCSVSNVFMHWKVPWGYCSTQFTDLLGVCVCKGQTKVVLLQQVEVLTHHVHQGLSFGVFLQRRMYVTWQW